MKRLRVLLVDFSKDEIHQIATVLRQAQVDVAWEALVRAGWEDLLPDPADFDLILQRMPPGDNAADGLFHGRTGQPLFAIIDAYDEKAVLRLMDAGAARVFSFQHVAATLPESLSALTRSMRRMGGVEADGLSAGNPGQISIADLQDRLSDASGTRNFLEAFFDTLAAIVVVLDRRGRILFFNQRAEQVTGYTFAEIEGRDLQDLFLLPEEKNDVIRIFNELRVQGLPNQFQNSWLCRDGSVRRIEWSNNVLMGNVGQLLYIIGMGIDVTDDYEKTRALLETEERFQSVFRQNPLAMAILRYPDGQILDVNRRLTSILELDYETLIGQPVSALKLLQPDEIDEHRLMINLSPSNLWQTERNILTSSSQLIHALLYMDLVTYAGQPCILLTIQDHTERVRSEERIQRFNEELERKILERTAALDAINRELQSEVSFRKAIESSTQRLVQILWETTDVVAISDNSGRILYLNKAGRRMFGANEIESVSHLSVYDGYSLQARKKILEEIKPYLEHENVWYGEMELTLPDRRLIPVSQVIIAHRNALGEIEFYSSIARDITDQRQASVELELAYEKERELGRMRANFFSMTSHQFRTPLSTILSSVELLEFYGERWSAEKRINHLMKIKEATNELTTLLTDILELSHMEARSSNLRVEAIDLGAVIQKQIQQFDLLDKVGHQIEVAGDLSASVLSSDRMAVERILENLLSNAIKYSPSGSIVDVHLARSQNGFRITIQDQGIGILEDDRDLIFEPFHRGSNVVDMPGSGIGLMIVKKSLELVKGKIDITSKPGEGTEVVVELPNLS